MAKPTGTSGFFRARVGLDGQIVGSFEMIPYSDDKAAIEKQMAGQFIASMNKHFEKNGSRFFLSDPQTNTENDFDLTVSSPNGPAYMELMEIAPLTGPYDQAPANYKPYDFGKAILEGILWKSNRYPKSLRRDLFLLLYVTHWSFTLSDTTIACLRYWLRRQPLTFRAVFTYQPLDAAEGVSHYLYPVRPKLLDTFEPEKIRDNICLNINPQNFRVSSESKP